jgi:hypothetical protein
MANDWISVNDKLPDDAKLKKYHVKMMAGSINPKVVESVILGKNRTTGFRFNSGDWETVTHWREFSG